MFKWNILLQGFIIVPGIKSLLVVVVIIVVVTVVLTIMRYYILLYRRGVSTRK